MHFWCILMSLDEIRSKNYIIPSILKYGICYSLTLSGGVDTSLASSLINCLHAWSSMSVSCYACVKLFVNRILLLFVKQYNGLGLTFHHRKNHRKSCCNVEFADYTMLLSRKYETCFLPLYVFFISVSLSFHTNVFCFIDNIAWGLYFPKWIFPYLYICMSHVLTSSSA